MPGMRVETVTDGQKESTRSEAGVEKKGRQRERKSKGGGEGDSSHIFLP
jgi:hypothetical protein